ncbi:hypothetical protein [Sorangium sp. So ce513]|uniref:hypothetical protein n=1 Tax=Sorangium sp. So ce513 TaxID=3133315 RepID=UPI003F5E1105
MPKKKKYYQSLFTLIEAINALEPGSVDETPSTPLIGAMLETITNHGLTLLLGHLLKDRLLLAQSKQLSRRSALFDKIIIMKGVERDWVLRLHTYNVLATTKDGKLVDNLGDEIEDDEANTHLHRWRLGSRFVTGGFNNVTWDVKKTSGPRRPTHAKFKIPATKHTKGKAREAELEGEDFLVTTRRSEFYQEGDIVTYPILDPHSVNMGLSAYTGTTMTLAHTGKNLLNDSYFFKKLNQGKAPPLESVRQIPYEEDELKEAIKLAIARLQLVDLNNELASRYEVYGHLNSFETELLPALAQVVALTRDSKDKEKEIDWTYIAQTVDLPIEAIDRLLDIDLESLAKLLVQSQRDLERQKFVAQAQRVTRKGGELDAYEDRHLRSKTPVNVQKSFGRTK